MPKLPFTHVIRWVVPDSFPQKPASCGPTSSEEFDNIAYFLLDGAYTKAI
jgi:hypothetical protein